MNQNIQKILAVDVAKETLAVYDGYLVAKVTNQPKGFEKIHALTTEPSRTLVVCEATGGYERSLIQWFQSRGIGVHVANPARVRAYAKGKGIQVKNDPVDAKVLYSFAVDNQPVASRVPSALEREIAALLDRRCHLSRELNREKNRREKEPSYIAEMIEKSVRFIEEQIEEIDQRVNDLTECNEPLREQRDLLTSVKGIGKLTAMTVLTYLPEITTVSRNKVVALAGLAPYDRDSGSQKGARFIHGGRSKIRRCLYMAAVSAARFNPIIRDYVARLKSRGKPFKCAIVAAMRKLIIHMQSLLKNNAPNPAIST